MGIGDGWCTDIDVTLNEIICSPPDELPGYRKKRSIQDQKEEFDIRDRIQHQVEDETEKFDNLNQDETLNHKTLLEMSIAQKLNKLRTKREIRRVQAAVIVYAGASFKLKAGSITYLIPEKSTTTQTTTTVINPIDNDPAAITSGDNDTVVTAMASVFGLLAFIAIAAALGNF